MPVLIITISDFAAIYLPPISPHTHTFFYIELNKHKEMASWKNSGPAHSSAIASGDAVSVFLRLMSRITLSIWCPGNFLWCVVCSRRGVALIKMECRLFDVLAPKVEVS
ncbi:hypothetical protein CEXT_509221 [Caerostris extrusa]|uniref:Uncharacterized protein n=1 Tax=Caerostris extrusa TaxID=172846 RepID=A0AAV4WTA1_CAEEX|nr:hypothetical protein CEXT_509221 [Caerostris extrusa]